MRLRLAAPLVCLIAAGIPLRAQRNAVTAADYARAEKFLGGIIVLCIVATVLAVLRIL
jgi:hypothetical protein